MEGVSNEPFVHGSLSDHPQQSISGSHTPEVHLQAHTVELKNKVYRNEVNYWWEMDKNKRNKNQENANVA